MTIPFDYPTLRVIWWGLLGILLIGFAIMDGFDLGIGILLHRVAHTNDERRLVLNTIGPIWEGNQIWLILGAGAIFAAWPDVYALAFSGFYFAMLMVLLSLILRPVGFKYRSKVHNQHWRAIWDICLFISGFVPALIFGVAIGNVLQGVPFYYDSSLNVFYTGHFVGLLNPFALLCGVLSVCMLCMHGANFLAIKTMDTIQQRAKQCVHYFGLLTLMLFAIAGIWLILFVPGYAITSPAVLDGPSNPLIKTVIHQPNAWLLNYVKYPLTLLAPILGFAGSALVLCLNRTRFTKLTWLMSACSIAGIITTAGVSMFPFILPSSTHPNMSLVVWDASSSHLTLFIMLIATILFLPFIILYTSWVYYTLRGKITPEFVKQNESHLY